MLKQQLGASSNDCFRNPWSPGEPQIILTSDHSKSHLYSASKRKEIQTHATTWMSLEDIMLNDISESQKIKSCRNPLIRGS